MTVSGAKPQAPLLTRGLQVLGLGAVIFGASLVTIENASLTRLFGVYLMVWGAVALLSGVRGRVGLVCLLLAIVAPLTLSWLSPLAGVLFLGVLFVLTRLSKDRVAPFYRRTAGA